MTITKEGALASFYTVNKAPIKHLRVYFSPQQEGEGDPSPENVREINGWSQLNLYHTGKNLCSAATDEEMIEKWLSNGAGKEQKIVGLPINQIFTLSTYVNKDFGESISNCRLYLYGALTSGQFLNTATPIGFKSRTGYPTSDGKLTIGHNRLGLTNFKVDLKNTQLEVGSVATKYEPYHGQTHTLDWSNDIGPVYGGYVDLITGELIQTYKLVDLGTLTYSYRSDLGGGIFCAYTVSTSDPMRPKINWIGVCSKYPYVGAYSKFTNLTQGVGFVYNEAIAVKDTNITIDDPAVIKESLDGVMLACELANPIIYQLTTQQLQTLVGQNNIWSNADRVEVEYDLAESNDELYRRRNIILRGYPHIETASGNIASFQTDLAAPIKDAKIYFNPIQLGSGEPSPENVREINGWNNINTFNSASMKKIIFKNFNNATITNGTAILNENGSITITGTGEAACNIYCDIEPILIDNSVNAVFSGSGEVALPTGKCSIRLLDANDSAILTTIIEGSDIYGDAVAPINLPENTNFTSNRIRITCTRALLNITMAPFYIYTGNNISSYNWSSTLGTIYGGYIDVIKGQLIQTWDIMTKEDIIYALQDRFVTNFSNFKGVRFKTPSTRYSASGDNYIYCTHFKDGGGVGNWSMDTSSKTGNIVECEGSDILFISSTLGFTSYEEWINWIEQNNVSLVYPLKDPITYQLTPTQLKTLKGTNNIWSNANGPVEITYWTH